MNINVSLLNPGLFVAYSVEHIKCPFPFRRNVVYMMRAIKLTIVDIPQVF